MNQEQYIPINTGGTGVPARDDPHVQDGHATGSATSSGGSIVTRRNGAYLPHWTQDGAIYAVTFRLFDSLPAATLDAWRCERENIISNAIQMGRSLSSQELERLDYLHSEKNRKMA